MLTMLWITAGIALWFVLPLPLAVMVGRRFAQGPAAAPTRSPRAVAAMGPSLV